MQTIIVLVIVALAAFFLIRRFINSFSQKNASSCGCSCDGCTPDESRECSDKEKPEL